MSNATLLGFFVGAILGGFIFGKIIIWTMRKTLSVNIFSKVLFVTPSLVLLFYYLARGVTGSFSRITVSVFGYFIPFLIIIYIENKKRSIPWATQLTLSLVVFASIYSYGAYHINFNAAIDSFTYGCYKKASKNKALISQYNQDQVLLYCKCVANRVLPATECKTVTGIWTNSHTENCSNNFAKSLEDQEGRDVLARTQKICLSDL